MKLTACVKNRETKNYKIIDGEYNTKKSFRQALNENGYIVKRISNNRDKAAQNEGFENFSKLREMVKILWSKDSELWENELEVFKTIKSIKL